MESYRIRQVFRTKMTMTLGKRFCWLVGALGVAMICGGCACVGPDYTAPDPNAPSSWRAPAMEAQGDAAPLGTWWNVFQDNALNEVLSAVRSENRSLAVAKARLESLAARYGMAQGELWPELGATGTVARDRQTEWAHNVGADLPDNPGTLLSLGAVMNWELDLWGRVRRSVEAARGELDAGTEDLRDMLVSLQAEAALKYIQLRTLQRRLAVAQKNILLQQETLGLARNRFEAGLTGELDVHQAEMNLAATRAQIPLLDAQIELALNALCVLSGRQPGAWDELRQGADIPTASALPRELPAEMLRQRPDVRRAERELAAQTARVGVATAELYPRLMLNGDFAFAATDSAKFFTSKAIDYTIGPSVRWAIFSGGRIRQTIKAEEAGVRAALLAYEGAVLGALAECEGALASYARERERRGRLDEAVEAARKSVHLAGDLYRNGLTDFQNVLDMQRQLSSYEDALANCEGSVAGELVGVYRAFGGGWEGTPAPSR